MSSGDVETVLTLGKVVLGTRWMYPHHLHPGREERTQQQCAGQGDSLLRRPGPAPDEGARLFCKGLPSWMSAGVRRRERPWECAAGSLGPRHLRGPRLRASGSASPGTAGPSPWAPSAAIPFHHPRLLRKVLSWF